jgi:hypothetical protein
MIVWHRDWYEQYDPGHIGTALREMRKRGKVVSDEAKDMDFATFRAMQATTTPTAEEPPDPERAEATTAAIDAMTMFG